jgi:predicted phosphodiesterase
MRDMQEFDQKNAEALRRLWFLGDVHGEFRHIGAALKTAAVASRLPCWLVFLGDIEIFERSFKDIMAPVRKAFPSVQVGFIHGNHDADDYDHWEALHDCGDAVALHGHVVSLDGILVAGLGGNFLGRVWAPPATPTFLNKTKAMERGPYGWRDGQRPSPRFLGAVYPDDVSSLAAHRADILITHEAPSCHHHGWEALDQLARDMRVVRSFHGHTHDDRSEDYALMRGKLGFDARAVNFCNIKNGLGELVSGPPPGMEDWS